jgi:hypothetical protein
MVLLSSLEICAGYTSDVPLRKTIAVAGQVSVRKVRN